jgi:eukaryotic-like serine/threonine-protein kinase
MIGKTVSHYRILSIIGKGGMGVVYRAEDTRLGRTVALKFLPEQFANDRSAVERFRREARAVSALNHSNICTLYDVDMSDSQPFLVMEYLEGQTLWERIHKQPLNLAELLDLSMQITDALDAAHARRVVHRDIKPSNIFITTRGQIKIMDFGLAKIEGLRPEAGSEAPTEILNPVTAPGSAFGTVGYMSPEQVRGEELDKRTDLFSLGVALYEMVTCKSPFLASNTAATFVAILHDQPVPAAQLRPDLPAELERIINKALEKDRDMRYQTASGMLADLKRLRRQVETVHTGVAPGSTFAVPRPAAPQPTTVIAAAKQVTRKVSRRLAFSMILAASAITAIILYFAFREQPLDSLAVLPFVNVGADPRIEYVSDGIAESIINNMSQLPKLSIRSFSSVVRYKGREVNAQAIGRELNVQAVLTGRLVQHGNEFDINAELIDVRNNRQIWGSQYHPKAADLIAIQEQISLEISQKLSVKLGGEEKRLMARGSTQDTEAYQLYLQGRYYWNKRTLEGLQQSIDYFQQAIRKDPRYALAYAGQADAYALVADFNVLSASEVMPQVKSTAAKALELDPALAEAHTSLAWARFHDWDWPGAETEFRRAIELNASYATAHSWYSEYLMALGRFDKALAEMNRALELDPQSPVTNLAPGLRLYYSRQYPQAIGQFQKTMAMDPLFVPAHVFLGRTYQQSARVPEAIAEFRKALELSGGDTNELATLGHALAISHQEGEARTILQQLTERSRQTYVQPTWVAVIHIGLGEKDQAFEWLQKAYQDRSAWLVYLRVDPYFDPVRSDPRFIDLVRRINFPDDASSGPIRAPVPSSVAQTNAKQVTPAPQPAADPVVPAPELAPAPAPVVEATPVPAALAQTVTVALTDGLPIQMTLAEDIPADADLGRPVRFTAAGDFRVHGVSVIRKGASITGEISGTPKKKVFGMGGGKLSFTISKADSIGGQTIKVRAAAAKRSDGPAQRAVEAGTRARSKDTAASKGTGYVGYIDGTQTVTVPQN